MIVNPGFGGLLYAGLLLNSPGKDSAGAFAASSASGLNVFMSIISTAKPSGVFLILLNCASSMS